LVAIPSTKGRPKHLVSADFFAVPTVFFRTIFVFVILSHDRRRPIHFAVTEYPTLNGSATVARGVSLERRATLSLARPRRKLRTEVSRSREIAGNPRGSHCNVVALAECLRGASDRIGSPRMFGSCDGSKRDRSPSNRGIVFRLLQTIPNSLVIGSCEKTPL
jgi:hypothetical protein